MQSNCLVVLSNRKYADLWGILIENYKKYGFFSDKFDLFITTDSIEGYEYLNKNSGFKFLLYPTNLSWIGALKFSVNNYLLNNYKYVLFSFDDLFITQIDTKRITSILTRNFLYYKILDTHINIYNLYQCKEYELNLRNVNDSYIGSLVFTIFKTDFFHKVLSQMPDNLNPWEYEFHISKYFPERSGFFCAQRSLISYQNLVIKGKFNPISKKNIESFFGINLKFERKAMSFWEVTRYYAKYFVWHFFRMLVPFSVQKFFRQKHQ